VTKKTFSSKLYDYYWLSSILNLISKHYIFIILTNILILRFETCLHDQIGQIWPRPNFFISLSCILILMTYNRERGVIFWPFWSFANLLDMKSYQLYYYVTVNNECRFSYCSNFQFTKYQRMSNEIPSLNKLQSL